MQFFQADEIYYATAHSCTRFLSGKNICSAAYTMQRAFNFNFVYAYAVRDRKKP